MLTDDPEPSPFARVPQPNPSMNVCWFTNVPFPSACRAAGRPEYVTGGWLSSLGEALAATGKVELLVVSFVAGGTDKSVRAGGCNHELIAIGPKRFFREWSCYPSVSVRKKCSEIVTRFQPDVVHVNGTESSYGLLLAEGDIRLPAVISIQGLLGAYTRNYYGGMSLVERLGSSSLGDVKGPGGLIRGRRILARRARNTERRVLLNDAIFVGRTLFDRAYLRAANPNARYCHCDEALRPQFFAAKRDPNKTVRHSVFAMGGDHPRKGFHALLKAVAQLKTEFPKIRVRACGLAPRASLLAGGYPRYLRSLIRSLRLEDHVVSLGQLDADGVAGELTRAHVFAFPSFADNSPNSLGEAMLVGVPIVASFAGGMPSIVRDGETALCFPMGDETVMAECLRTMFTNDDLAQSLARNARQVARERHDPERVACRMLDIYTAARKGWTGGGA